jgi:hypothetical protein
LDQVVNFKGVAEIIRDYQKSIQPLGDNEPVDLEEFRGCGGRGIRDQMGWRLPGSRRSAGKRSAGLSRTSLFVCARRSRLWRSVTQILNRNIYALIEKQLARKDEKLEAEEKENADLNSKNDDLKTEVLEIKSELFLLLLAKTASSTKETTKSWTTETTRR